MVFWSVEISQENFKLTVFDFSVIKMNTFIPILNHNNTKNGNWYLALAFVEAAHYAAIWEPTIKRYYQRKCKRVPLMVAKKTIANKLTRACYHMIKSKKVFEVTRAFGEEV